MAWCKVCGQKPVGNSTYGYPGVCYTCGEGIDRAKRMPLPAVEVVSLGSFAGGSYGIPGNPSKVYPYWTVKCDANSGDFPRPEYTYTSESAARKHADSIVKDARDARDAAVKAATRGVAV